MDLAASPSLLTFTGTYIFSFSVDPLLLVSGKYKAEVVAFGMDLDTGTGYVFSNVAALNKKKNPTFPCRKKRIVFSYCCLFFF